MAGSTIGTIVNQGITLGTVSSYPTYASPLTITNTGAVNSGTASSAVYGPSTSAWSVYNYGRVTGAGGGILLEAGGAVVNGSAASATASISGYTGVEIDGAGGTVANAGLIESTGTGASGNAVAMNSGGTVSNVLTGTISGGFDAVFILGGVGTVTNYGTIQATGADGVALINGGLVENLATGTAGGQIFANDYGVRILSAAGTVVNSGTIISYGYHQVGVYLGAGGTVTNSVGGYIRGFYGVRVSGTAGTVVNAGYIGATGVGGVSGPSAIGLDFAASGALTNMAGGSIDGVKIAGGGSVDNQAGALIQGGKYGIYVSGDATVTNGPGALIQGNDRGISVRSGYGTIANAGSILGGPGTAARGGYYGVFVDNGGTVTNAANALIYGADTGVYVFDGTAIVGNQGTITGGYRYGIYFFGESVLNNDANGLIQGGFNGVNVRCGYGSIVNAGTILGGPALPTKGKHYGVYLGDTGSITNSSGGLIQGADSGVYAFGATTVANEGTIVGGYRYGLFINSGYSQGVAEAALAETAAVQSLSTYSSNATITNPAGALIAGGYSGIDIASGSGTVTNSGAIFGQARYGISFAAGGTIVNASTGLIEGAANGVRVNALSSLPGYRYSTGLGSWKFTNSSGTGYAPVAYSYGVANPAWANRYNWIVDNNAGTTSGGLPLSFSTTFDLTGFNPSTAQLSGQWAVDDAGLLELNGHVIADLSSVGTANYTTLHSFSVAGANGYFQSGVNTLSVVLTTADNSFDGVDVQISSLTASRPQTLVNSGTIAGTGTAGIGVVFASAGATLTNAGTVVGAGGAAVSFYGGQNRLVVDPGAVFSGVVSGGAAGGGNALELAGGTGTGSIAGIGSQYVNFDSVSINAGAAWLFSGTDTSGGAIAAGAGSTVINAGMIVGTGGTAVAFSGDNNRLVIDPGASFVGVANFGAGTGDVVELAAGTAFTVSGYGSYTLNFGSFSITSAAPLPIELDAGASLQLTGSNAILAGRTLVSNMMLTNSGNISIDPGGALVYSGTLDNSGIISIAPGGVLEDPGTTNNSGTIFGTVTLTGGSYLHNYPTGLITTYGTAAVLGINSPNSVTNVGTISGTGTAGISVDLTSGGIVTNQAGGLISGTARGVEIFGAAGAVTNAGSIDGGSGPAVSLGAGGTINNSGTISNATTIAATLLLTAGGDVTNSAGLITGLGGVMQVQGGTGTVTNFGTIANSAFDAIYLGAGGLLTNGAPGNATALISAPSSNAVTIQGGLGTIVNFGSIVNATTATPATHLAAGGTVVNGASNSTAALIESASNAVVVTGGAGSITNFGTIASSAGFPTVYLGAGGTVTNAAGATIASVANAISARGGAAMVVNSGVIANSGTKSAIYIRDGGFVTNNPGGTIGSARTGISFDNISGTAVSIGTVVNAGLISSTATGSSGVGIYLAQGGAITNLATGVIAATGRGGVSVEAGAGTVLNEGLIQSGGTFNSGVYLGAGGAVTNAAGGAIAAAWVGVDGRNSAAAVVNYGTIASTATFTQPGSLLGAPGATLFGVGVVLEQGGVVVNQAGGLITGYEDGVYAGGVAGAPHAGATTTVVNNGVISSTGAGSNGRIGVHLSSGGLIANSGAITSQAEGAIHITGTVAGTVVNSGLIENFTTAHSAVYIAAGGLVTNNTGATITSPRTAVAFRDTAGTTISFGTVVNAGTITGGANYSGVYFGEGGVITNLAGGAISGHTGIGFNDTLGTVPSIGTVMNSGTIAGTATGVVFAEGGILVNAGAISGADGTAVVFGGSGNLVVVDPGAVFNGVVNAGTGGGNTLELAAGGGALVGIGASFVGFGTVAVDSGANWQLSGVNVAPPAFADNGTVTVGSGSILYLGAASGSGAVDVAMGATAVFEGTVSLGQGVALGGIGSKIDLTDFSGEYLQGFATTIAGLAVSPSTTPVNEVELSGVTFGNITAAFLSGNTITVQEGGATVASLVLAAAPPAGTVAEEAADPSGGTDIFLTVGAAPAIAITSPAAGTSFADPDSGLTIGGTTNDVEDGQIVTVQIADSANTVRDTLTTAVSGGLWSAGLTAAQVQALGPGPFTIGAGVSDVAGNAAPQATDQFSLVAASEAPNLIGSVLNLTGTQNSAVPLTIVAAPADADDNVSINISGVPAGASLSAGTLNPDGSYTLTPAQLPGLQFDSGLTGAVLHVVATNTEDGAAASSSINVAVSIDTLFNFVYTYPDGRDYYLGTAADNGTFGYQPGQTITLPGGGQYQITETGGTTTEAPGTVTVTSYSHGGIGAASPVPQQSAAGQPDGVAGLGSEADTLLGTDGVAHPFSPIAEASFPTATLYGFVYDYADGSAYYTGTVADDGSIGYANTVATANATILVQDPATGALAGRYTLFAEGQTTDANGTVRLQSYVDGTSGNTLSLGGMIAGMGGVSSEVASFSLNGVPFTFSDTQELVDPPAPTLPPAIGAPTPNTPTAPSPDLALVDTTTGQAIGAAATAYSGPVPGLQHQYLYTGDDNVNIAVTSDDWFLKGGAGTDALQAFGGYNVLDGSTGSNFLTGGSGTDTFFVDDRGPSSDIWSTVNGFHAGDDATVFGVVPAPDQSNVQWFDNQGAAGYTGLTLHVLTPGAPTASLTLTGYSASDLSNGRLSVQFGSETDGTSYMHIIAQG